MKKLVIVLLCGLCLFACKKKQADEPVVRPSWTVDTLNTTYSSMTVTMDASSVPLNQISETDLVGAFVGETCRGTATPQLCEDGKNRYFLVIAPSELELQNDIQVTLRYYSTSVGIIYESETFTYEDNGIAGTIANPYKPTWKIQ